VSRRATEAVHSTWTTPIAGTPSVVVAGWSTVPSAKRAFVVRGNIGKSSRSIVPPDERHVATELAKTCALDVAEDERRGLDGEHAGRGARVACEAAQPISSKGRDRSAVEAIGSVAVGVVD
jgi:hypothetical protein